MSLGKLKPILILGLVILTTAPATFGQRTCYAPEGTPPLSTSTEYITPMYGYYGIGPTAFVAQDIANVQMILRTRGVYFGNFNGVLTDETIDAVRRFQAANNLPATGVLDARTQMALGVTIKGTATTTAAYSRFDASICEQPMNRTLEGELSQPEISTEIEQTELEAVPLTRMQAPPAIRPPQAVAVVLSEANLQEVRKALQERGFGPGPGQGEKADWVDAIRRFQWEYDIPATGYLDQATLSALNLRFEIHGPRPGTMRVWRSGRYPAKAPEVTPDNNEK
jgi:peptidoglycan hydrolase-like protein with peptidoglycan-binding domain